MNSGPGQLQPQNCHSLMIICLKICEIWAWPTGAPNLSFLFFVCVDACLRDCSFVYMFAPLFVALLNCLFARLLSCLLGCLPASACSFGWSLACLIACHTLYWSCPLTPNAAGQTILCPSSGPKLARALAGSGSKPCTPARANAPPANTCQQLRPHTWRSKPQRTSRINRTKSRTKKMIALSAKELRHTDNSIEILFENEN